MKRVPGFALQQIAGESLLVPTGARVMDLNALVTLNAVGTCLWQLLERECSVDDLVAGVTEQFDVTADVARADVSAFLEQLRASGLVQA